MEKYDSMDLLNQSKHTGRYTAFGINKIVMFMLAVLFVFQAHLGAQMVISAGEEESFDTKRQVGLGFAMVESGSSLGFFIGWPLLQDYHFGFAFDGFILRDSKQVDTYDPYSGMPYSMNKQNNVYIFDLTVTMKKRLFKQDLSDEFRPFISAGLGPVYGMNFPETSRDANNLAKKDEYRWTMGGFVGAGVDFSVKSNHLVSIRAQYRVMPFAETLGERENHSMFELRFELAQRF
jgi:opacity protein-like surface antigen